MLKIKDDIDSKDLEQVEDKMDEKLLKIINTYGVIPQLKYFQSEVFELNEAIIKYENIPNGINDYIKENYKDNIAEELADVEVMLLQFKEYYHIDGNKILETMNNKINRQLDRIEQVSEEYLI